jgi:hypothetical protein
VQAEEPLPSTWIQISPVSSRLDLSPGQQHDGTIKVVNVGADSFDFKVYANAYGVTDLDYEPVFGETGTYSRLADWISFEKTEYQALEPNQTLEVPYTITVPEDSPGGGQYAVIFAETKNPENQNISGAAISTVSRVGSLVFANLGGDARSVGELVSFEQPFWQSGPVKSETIIKNSGNVDFVTHQEFTVSTLFGKEVYSNSADKFVLPETSRRLTQEWAETPAIGLFMVANQVDFLSGGQINDSKLVLVGPLWAIITICVILLLILILIVLIIVRKVKKGKKNLKK